MRAKIFSERQHASDTSYSVRKTTCPNVELSATTKTGKKQTDGTKKKKAFCAYFLFKQYFQCTYTVLSAQDFEHSDALNVNEYETVAVKQVRSAPAGRRLAACRLQKFNVTEIL